ncbi:bile acid:sodium symporter [Mycobacterium camsae]|uniref:bile acid:sodium symporter n=1 Tax=Mycobacterium gordonae TaxID=1778 RepID=UPI001981D838|nr:bile acid:sodium symporter [Mycobacterium gordonae]
MRRFVPDSLLIVVVAAIVLALLLPARGAVETAVNAMTRAAIAALFLLYGSRMSPHNARQGLSRWRLHASILACTFVLFPALAITVRLLVAPIVSGPVCVGLVFLAVVPSTTLSSIAFTSIARGSVGDAVIGASASNLLGIVLTPLLSFLLIHNSIHARLDGTVAAEIALQLLLPYLLGLLLRPLLAPRLARHGKQVTFLERTALALVVYAAFITGIEAQTARSSALVVVALCCTALFTAMLGLTKGLGAALKLARDERIVLVFCGTQKSMATGLPLALVLFHGPQIGLTLLPLVVYYQLQIVAGSRNAARYARHRTIADSSAAV